MLISVSIKLNGSFIGMLNRHICLRVYFLFRSEGSADYY